MVQRYPLQPPAGETWSASLVVSLVFLGLPVLLALARARLRLRRLTGSDIRAMNSHVQAQSNSSPGSGVDVRRQTGRIAWLVPRLARRVPWRADCLVQAMAGQKLLAARGIISQIVIGVDLHAKDDGDGRTFAAHAWLHQGANVVTGGDISRYEVLLDR